MNRTLVFGDIHGGLKALRQLFEKAAITTKDRLIFLGDYVDGWNDTPEVLDFLIELNQSHQCVFMRGNHDELLYQYLTKGTADIRWKKHGGASSIICYSTVSQERKNKHIQFLESLLNYHIDDQNRLFVHAGFTSTEGVLSEFFPTMLYWDRTLWETALALNPELDRNSLSYPKRFLIYKEIFIGHTPLTRIGETLPKSKASVWNLDTGAAFKGPLTVMDVDTKRYWQSQNVYEFYPDENGRN